ncbi:MAG TPA: ATP-binding cassette domain-containing protein, partial [Oculatellaceae cyanobacterium]
YGPELVNRFFDTLSIQRTLSKLLVNVPAALAQVLIGLILMASYSPLLLAFDLVIMGTIVLIALLGRGGLRLSIEESGFKYNVAHWLEEIARCHVSFKLARADRFVLEQTDQRIVSYIEARKAHFQVLLRQNMGNIVLQAFGGAGILAIGGWLVINRQLTLGQLVAAELVMIYVLSAMDVLTTQLEDGYDLLTGYEKVGEVVDLPTERTTGLEIPSQPTLSISCRRLHFAYDNQPPILKDLNLDIEKGQKVSLVGSNGAGKTTFAYLLAGLLEPSYGTVLLGGTDIRELELRSLRRKVTFIGDASEIFSGTIEENITLGQPISRHVLQEVVDQVLLTPMLVTLPKGLQTQLNSEGRNLSLGQRQQILVARALVGQPELIIVDEALTGMDQLTKTAICEILLGSEQPWTLLVISHDPMLFLRTEKIYVLKDGHIVESGAPKELLSKEDSELLQLFPAISRKFLQEVLTA